MDALTFFWLFLKASLFSTGGMGNLPILHEDLLGRGWATEQNFAEALAVGQISPGPNGLWVISLGYLTAGWLGSALACIAITIPPMLIVFIDRLHRRVEDREEVKGFARGLALAVTGVFVVVLWGLLESNGLDAGAVLIALGSIGLGLTGRAPVFVILALAAVCGVFLYG